MTRSNRGAVRQPTAALQFITAVALLALLPVVGNAQTDPRTLPAVAPGDVTYVGSFTAPASDGVDGTDAHLLAYGGSGVGMGPDGASLYVACYPTAYARISIPAIGQRATVIEPCKMLNLGGINPSNPNNGKIGGALSWNGRAVVSGYTYYDGDKSAVASHLANGAGPFRVGTENPGLVGGYMGVVPQEWRGLFGGPALTGQCCLSIIGRSSYGPAVSVFDPDHLGTVNPVPASMLVGYPDAHQTIGTYQSPGNLTGFGMSTTIAGVAMPGGTSSVLFIGRQGTTACYGTGAACNDPTNPNQGDHGYPYFPSLWIFKAGDLADVKAGAKQPWDVRPVSISVLPGGATPRAAVYDPASRRIYATGHYGDAPTIYVWQVGAAPPPQSPAVDCAGVWSETLSEPTPLACDAAQVQTRTRTRSFTVVTPATNGGAACPASPVVAQETASCSYTPPPPPPLPTVAGRVRAQSMVTAGLRLTLDVPDAQALPAKGAAVTVNIAGATHQATIFDIDRSYYTGAPRSTRLILTVPGLSYVSVVVSLP